MSRNGHHGTVTIISENVVSCPDRQTLPVDRIDRVATEEDTRLGTISCLAFDFGGLLNLGEVVGKCCLNFRSRTSCKLCCEVSIRSNNHESCSMKSVRTRGEDGHGLVTAFDDEVNICTNRATNPVALHGEHLGRPLAFEGVEIIE